ncbi:MAG: polysaccharide biosynthesis/export family protein [Bryobacterales bacterium]|nr:polysaccharide biosynthesis/export family protein [Bryobacterales bacterium]
MSLVRTFAWSIVWTGLFFAQRQAFAQVQPVGRPTYTLAPKDHILIRAPQSEKLNGQIFQVDPRGFVTLPSVGRIRAAGMTLGGRRKN